MPGLAHLRILIRRHRRIVAACCAGLAALLALSVLRSTTAPMSATAGSPGEAGLGSGEVAVPVSLVSAAHARALHAGDAIDLVAVPRTDDRTARVVARDATVLSVASGGFGAPDGSVVVIAVPRSDALAIADAMTAFTFTAWVTSAMPPQPAQAE